MSEQAGIDGTGTSSHAAARGLPFQVRGTLQTILSLRLIAPRHPDFFALLHTKIAHSPDFFRAAPLILDVGPIAHEPPVDLPELLDRLRQERLTPVGIRNGSEAWNEAAARAGLAMFAAGTETAPEPPPSRPPSRDRRQPQAPAATAPAAGPATVLDQPIRGGQQVHASEGDLVVTATVGHGAELAAAGHIHVYGALRGRAFAGIGGDERAMIFCDQLEAELLSIAGVHLVNEELDPQLIGRRVRVSVRGERLLVQAAG